MASFIRCDGCERELRPAERLQVRVRVYAAADGERMDRIAEAEDRDVCRACRDRLCRDADPKNWPRAGTSAADRLRIAEGVARQQRGAA